jgi:hypothetical protein
MSEITLSKIREVSESLRKCRGTLGEIAIKISETEEALSAAEESVREGNRGVEAAKTAWRKANK